jgi:hypothetical protein
MKENSKELAAAKKKLLSKQRPPLCKIVGRSGEVRTSDDFPISDEELLIRH